MRAVLLALVLLFASSYPAQSELPKSETSYEVDRTLWRLFKQAYDNKDAEAFNALHTDDVMRISPWGIKIGEEYKASNRQSFEKSPERSQTIDFAMEHRIYTLDEGYEVGFYRIIYTVGDEVVHSSYARFHVRLRKEDGEWKIAQDWDIHQILDEEITVKHFEKADLLEFTEE